MCIRDRYQWGYRIAMITAGAAPLLLANAYSWNFSYAVMAALMSIGMVAVLIAPVENSRQLRPIHDEGLKASPAIESIEWLARFVLLMCGAILVGCGLAANAAALDWLLSALGASGAGDAVVAAWQSR